jgi:hypothetical protein
VNRTGKKDYLIGHFPGLSLELVGGGERNGSLALPSLTASQRWTQVHCGSGKAAREKKVEAKECSPFDKKRNEAQGRQW